MYTVVWKPNATRMLAEFYLTALENGYDAAAITEAVAFSDTELARRPRDIGESRIGMIRILIEEPLLFEYEVVEDDKKVIVTRLVYQPR